MARKPTIADVLGFGGVPKRDLTQGLRRAVARPTVATGSLKPAYRTVSQRIAEVVTPNTKGGVKAARQIQGILDFVTALGSEEDLVQSQGAFQRGDYGVAAKFGILAALGAIPGAKPEAMAAREIIGSGGPKIPKLFHGGAVGLTPETIQIVREAGATRQGSRGRSYGGFYTTANPEEAAGYAGMGRGPSTTYQVGLKPDAVVAEHAGDITRLSPDTINAYRNNGVDVVVGKDIRGRTEYAVINRDVINSLQDMGK